MSANDTERLARGHARDKFVCHGYYVLFGMVGTGLMPALVKSFEDAYDLSHRDMGLVTGVTAVILAWAAYVGGAWYDRRGARSVLSATMVLCSFSAVGMFFVSSTLPFILALIAFQFSNGLGAVVNPVVGQLYGAHRTRGMNLLHGFQGVGRALAPVLVMVCLELTEKWQVSFLASAGLFAVWFFVVQLGLSKESAAPATPADDAARTVSVASMLRDRTLLVGITGFVFLSGCEISLITWIPDFLEAEAKFSKSQALTSLTFMMAGYTTIRFCLGAVRGRVSVRTVAVGILLLVATFLVIVNAGHRHVVYGSCFLLGLSFGAYWPSTAAAVYDYAASGHGKITGFLNIASTVGALAFVSLVGWLGDVFGLRYALFLAPACAGAYAALYLAFTRMARKSVAP